MSDEFETTPEEFDRMLEQGEPAVIVGMIWEYDPTVNAGYVRLGTGAVARTLAVDPAVNLDLDAEGRLVGVEILGRHNLPSSTTSGSNSTSVTFDFGTAS